MNDRLALRAEPFEASRHLTSLLALFDASYNTCFCRYWHFEGDKNGWLERCSIEHGTNQREFEAAAEAGSDEARGVVALWGEQVVGWAKVSPAEVVGKVYEQRYYRGLKILQADRTGVFTLGCMLVHPDFRRQGVAKILARGAVEAARGWGARVLEALPRTVTEPVADEELFMGPEAALVEAGFSCANEARPYPVMRIALL